MAPCAAPVPNKNPRWRAQQLIAFFAHLIAEQVEREQLLRQLQQANDELSRLALSDPLTGLPNRRALMLELTRLFSLSERAGHPVLIAFVDLDGFKAINDEHGHEAGDRLLTAMARQLSETLRGGDLLARFGGTSSWPWAWGLSRTPTRWTGRWRRFASACSSTACCHCRWGTR